MTLVLPYAAGGPVDVVGRIVAPRMSEILGRQVVIENVVGAGGITGVLRVRKAPPDGYQFVISAAGTFAHSQTLFKKPPYNSADRFRFDRVDCGGAADPGHDQQDSRRAISRNSSLTPRQTRASCSMPRAAPRRARTSPACS